MAKELPYFKFEPGEWETGNIQLVDFETQGIFINICSIYWQRLGDLPYKLAVQKVCGGNATALKSLSDENIIEVIEGKIYIKFLDEQLSEFENTSNQNRKNALKRWRKKRDATAKQSQSDGNAIREDKIREDKSKEDKIDIPSFDEFKNYAIDNKPNIDLTSLKLKYNAWVENGWKDGKDKKIKNWKTKLLNTLDYLKESKSGNINKPRLA